MTGLPTLYRRSRLAWRVLAVCLALETLLLAWLVITMGAAAVGAMAASTEFAAQNFSMVAVCAICLAWVLVTLFASVRLRVSWVRGSAVTIHVLLFAAGTGSLQLVLGPVWLGFGLIALALVGFFAALLAVPVISLFGEPDRTETEV